MNENKFGTTKKPLESKSNAVKLVDGKVVDNLDEGKTVGKRLAILGHSTRGNEIIELLEMMGGSNIHNLSGNDIYSYYIIKGFKNEIRDELYIFGNENIYYFTLEKFLEKYPFKVGDKVVYTKFGDNCDDYPVTIESMKWTGTTIEYTFNDCVTCLAKDLEMWNGEPDAVISGIYLNSCEYADEVELNLGDYKIEVRDGRTFAVKKKPKYPTIYEECCQHLGCDDKLSVGKLIPFQQLINARNAYWKIAGKEMGLDKPWEPTSDSVYGITRYCGIVCHSYNCGKSSILEFPTEEMRNAFYDNFKNLIENCKELL